MLTLIQIIPLTYLFNFDMAKIRISLNNDLIVSPINWQGHTINIYFQ